MGVDEFYEMLPRHFWNIHLSKGKTIKPTDLIQFEWDKKTKKLDYEKLKAKAEYIKKMEENG